MLISLTHYSKLCTADLSKPIDISIVLKNGVENPNCFFAPEPYFSPVQAENFIGDTQQGGVVNFFNVTINPHGNGTHTECVGHIAKERFYINDCLKNFHSIGVLITIAPVLKNGDFIIEKSLLEQKIKIEQAKIGDHFIQTLIIRTLPNTPEKLNKNYSNTNPAYFTNDAMEYIVNLGVQHLIVDLPSVDKEQDEGKLSAHHIFWNYPTMTRKNATITELVFIDAAIEDGLYLTNIQIMPIALDASSSKVVLYALNLQQ